MSSNTVLKENNLVKDRLECNEINLVEHNHFNDAELHVNNIKRNHDGYTAIGIKENKVKWNQWHIKNEDLIKNLSKFIGLEDVYISINSMLSPLRQLKNLRHLHAFWVDLDYYNVDKLKGLSSEQVISYLRKKRLFEDLEPSFFIDSGNGLYIFYLIESATVGALPIWQRIQSTIQERFLKYGADTQSIDAVHVLRLAGTKNSKTNRFARYIYNSKGEFEFEKSKESIRIYTIKNIGDIILPSLPDFKKEEKVKKSTQEDKKKNSRVDLDFFNIHTLHYSRLNDIEKIQQLRNGECIGKREIMCFLYRYYSCLFIKNEETALINVIEFNKGFKEPLPLEELKKATHSAEDAFKQYEDTLNKYLALEVKPNMAKFFSSNKCYMYSNKKLISLLEITNEEMESLSTIISIKEKNRRSKDYRNEWKKEDSKKKRRNSEGLTTREQNKLNNLINIIRLKGNGATQKEISIQLNITQQAISKLYKEYLEEKLSLKIQEALKLLLESDKNNNNYVNYEKETNFDELSNF
ncbi:MAG: hypothetical protein ACRC2K_01485 [Clostridium sp.]